MRRAVRIGALGCIAAAIVVIGYLVPHWVAVQPGIAGCQSLTRFHSRETCVRERAKTAITNDGMRAAERTLDDAAQIPAINAVCHTALHPVGQTIGARSAAAGSKLPLATPNTNCTQGLAHGLTIGYLSRATYAQITTINLRQCPGVKDGAGRDSKQSEACVHALGHALYRQKRDMAAGAGVCQKLATRASASLPLNQVSLLTDSCIGGMLMERAVAHRSAADSCPTVPAGTTAAAPLVRHACLRYIPVNMSLVGSSPRAIATACNRLARGTAEQSACAQGFASVSSVQRSCRMLTAPASTMCRMEWGMLHTKLT